MKRYAQKSFELEEQKKKNEILSAQLQQLRAREGEVQARLQLMSSMVQPAETAVPPSVAPQPGPSSSSAVVSSQPVANTSSVVPPPLPPQQLEVPTAFQPTSFAANVEQSYNFDLLSDDVPAFPDFDLPSDALPTFPDFAQGFGTLPPPQLDSSAPFEDQWQQAIDFDGMPQVILDLSQQQQQGLMFPAQPYPQINCFDQLSNRGPEEHHLGTLQQQQVEQVQHYGNLPHETHNLTNGNYYQQGNGATTSSSTTSSSKRKRDENEERANNQQEAGGGPSPPKRKRTRSRENKSGDKGKGREVATATVKVNENTTSKSSKRKRDEAGDDASASNEAGGSGSAQ
jgi:hypothetical protein